MKDISRKGKPQTKNRVPDNGKTPYQTFLDSKKIAKEKNLSNLFDNKNNNFDNKNSVINSIENH